MIEAYITNLGKYVEGKLVGEFLKFPSTTQEVQALLQRIGVDGIRYEEIFITDYKTSVAGLRNHLGEDENIDEMNYFTSLLSEMQDWELEKFQAMALYEDCTEGLKDLINLAQNLDCYEYYPGVKDYQELGYCLIEELEYEEIPEYIKPYFDYESYARDYLINVGGQFTKSGFIFQNDVDPKEHYNGHDLPREYIIFSYPPPEKSIKKALENYQKSIQEMPSPTPKRDRSHTHAEL